MTNFLLSRLFPQDGHHVAGLHARLRQVMPRTGRVLDLGCGANRDLAEYRSPGREVWGTDFQRHSQLEHPEWFRPLDEDGTIPFPDSSIDVVVAVMVLEHVAEPGVFLKEIARVLRPGGHFVGHTISGSHYVTWLRRAFGLLPHSVSQRLVRTLYGRVEEDTFPAFYRLNRLAQLKQHCHCSGLGEPRLSRYEDPGYFAFSRPLCVGAIVADRLFDLARPGWGRLYFTVISRKVAIRASNSKAESI